MMCKRFNGDSMLRGYQTDIIEEIRLAMQEHRRILAVVPTGSGKTYTFCTIAQRCSIRNHNVLILVHRSELIEQTSARLREMEVPHGIIAPGYKIEHKQIQIASIQAATRRLSAFPWSPNLIIVDEAHHCLAKSWTQALSAHPQAKIIGWTATPQRLDGKGLTDSFDVMIEGPSAARLIALGALSKFRIFCPPGRPDLAGISKRGGDYATGELEARVDQRKILAAAVKNYQLYAGGRQTIGFCVSIAHAQHVCNAFAEVGISAITVDGSMSRNDRAAALTAFKSKAVRILLSVDLISEGFDVPACNCALLLRPTASLALYLQQVGRALRPSDEDAIILDCCGNAEVHGLPDSEREWSLEGKTKKKKGLVDAIAVRVCPTCFGVHAPAPKCPYCQYLYKVDREIPVEDDIVLVDRTAELKAKKKEVGRARTLEELQLIGQQRGYKPGWAHAVMKSRKYD